MSKKLQFDDRGKYLMTREEAHLAGLKHYYTGKPCRGRSGPHDNLRYVKTGGCVECKQLENDRRENRKRYKNDPNFKQQISDRDKERQSLGLGFGSMPGGGGGFRTLVPQGAIGKADDAETNRVTRAACPHWKQRDHICPVPQKRDHVQILIGLECAENLQVLTPADNQVKSNGLPHPSDFTRRAERQLTIDEMRSFVEHRMAVWAHDVTLGSNGKRAIVRWELYRLGADGLVEYLGQEPMLAEAAE